MRKGFSLLLILIFSLCSPSWIMAAQPAPRISDREIVERLTRLEERLEAVDKRFEAVDKRFEAVDKRFDDLRSEMNARFEAMDKRFDTIQWILSLFVTISLIILGFVLRMQWQIQKRQARMETALETQKDEITFLKGLIEKLLPSKSAL